MPLNDLEVWFTGTNPSLHPSTARIKRFLIKKFGPACWECGWSNKNPFTGKWVIDLDHVDGDHLNDSPHNFRLLCPNCHAMTPTYKALNHQKVRAGRGVCVPVVDEDYYGDLD